MRNGYLRALLPLLILITAVGSANSASYTNTIDLSGEWNVTTDDGVERRVMVPGSLESQFADLRSYSGKAVYRREFPIPQTWAGKQIVLEFGAVDWLAEVSVNGKRIGAHEGGYTPFRFDITSDVIVGRWNELEVAVTDVAPSRSIGALVFDEIPHGRQASHGTQSGIWQNVRLEAVDRVGISKVRVTPDIDRGVIRVSVALNQAPIAGELRLNVIGEGAAPGATVIPLAAGKSEYETEIRLDAPKLWEPGSPHLYKLQARLKIGGRLSDAHVTEFGMRKIEVRDGRIYLNNQPIFIIGALDQDYYPLTGFTPPSDQYLRAQFQRARHMGINLVRCQGKIPDPQYLEWADRAGVIVWYEMPGFEKLNERSQTRAKLLMAEALERDYNRASLCIVSLMGDGWGMDPSNAERQAWQRVMCESARALDPTRLIIDNSPSETYNYILSAPVEPDDFAAWVSGVASKSGDTFSALNESGKRASGPLLISAPGSWGLPRLSDVRKTYGGDPWWFETGSGASRAAGVEQRFAEQGLGDVFGAMDVLAEACQWQQWDSLKSRIEEMRRHPQIAGYVLGQFSDVNWESDGLLSADRKPKVFYDKVKCVQGVDVIIPDRRAANYWSGSRFSMDVLVSHMSKSKLRDCKLKWRLEGHDLRGEIGVSIDDPGVAKASAIEFAVPSVSKPTEARLALTLVSQSGAAITDNYADIGIYPRPKPSSRTKIAVRDPDGELSGLRSHLSADGYSVSEALDQNAVAITNRLDAQVRDFIAKGGRVILVADDPESIPRLANSDLAVQERDGSEQWGDSSKCFTWVRNAGPMKDLTIRRVGGVALSAMQPKSVLTGLDMTKRADVFGGLFVGWLHYPATIAAQFKAGDGRVLVTTLDVLSAYGIDPAATTFLANAITYASGDDFRPSMSVDLTTAP